MAVDAAAMGAESGAAGLSPAAQSAVSEAKAGRGTKLSPAVKQELSQPASAPASTPDSSSSSSSAPTWSMPDLGGIYGGIPGKSIGEKALLVAGVLLLGLFFYSRVTGKPIALALAGPSSAAPVAPNPNAVGQVSAANSMKQRVAAVNPSKAS